MKMISCSHARQELRRNSSPAKARVLKSFFKTGPGEYSEKDIFIGVKVPDIRRIAAACDRLGPGPVRALLRSTVHEERLLALLILARQYAAGTMRVRKAIVRTYLTHTSRINNWDLVDLSASYILGDWLKDKGRGELVKLARSRDMWERRIAIVATHAFIRQGQCRDTFRIAAMLLEDKEDLIHKAAGWMLREAGKRDIRALKVFLKRHEARMPRTMLRYAIERFPEKERRSYLKK